MIINHHYTALSNYEVDDIIIDGIPVSLQHVVNFLRFRNFEEARLTIINNMLIFEQTITYYTVSF